MKATPTGAGSEIALGRELGLVRILPLSSMTPARVNDLIYRPVDITDPAIKSLSLGICKNGLLEPIVLTRDSVIVSGHRRYAACRLAGLREAPCRVMDIVSSDADFAAMLTAFNDQRAKTFAEQLREKVIQSDPEESYRLLVEHRRQAAGIPTQALRLSAGKARAALSPAKVPLLSAIRSVLEERRAFWPVSDRQIHYALLNNPPLIHASKPDSTYQNTPQCYKALTDILTRARMAGLIAMEVISDETRPVIVCDVHPAPDTFIKSEMDGFLKGFYRDLMQSQPNHIEILGEKNTVQGVLRPIAEQYRIPFTTSRGYCSLPPRHNMAERFRKSGKSKLILLVLSDFDPDGEEICHSFARSMRDDFGVKDIHAEKVALRQDQAIRYNLPPSMDAKPTSSNYKKFVKQFGTQVFELEALPPAEMQDILRRAIDSVIDVAAFNQEVDAEKQDAAQLDQVRQQVHLMLREINL